MLFANRDMQRRAPVALRQPCASPAWLAGLVASISASQVFVGPPQLNYLTAENRAQDGASGVINVMGVMKPRPVHSPAIVDDMRCLAGGCIEDSLSGWPSQNHHPQAETSHSTHAVTAWVGIRRQAKSHRPGAPTRLHTNPALAIIGPPWLAGSLLASRKTSQTGCGVYSGANSGFPGAPGLPQPTIIAPALPRPPPHAHITKQLSLLNLVASQTTSPLT
ncbi:hypothetical protein NLG97_g10975 [Lecanicillium saksenae]|uniref:Uncharacterized protein n=1 Tax=Lecanicillium saksenae TaxID=468837 RepID=A0ACC1QBW7_9HYPO|nr:hypothetical protein NLG97_g10975 [Lecanicillium saksenae]